MIEGHYSKNLIEDSCFLDFQKWMADELAYALGEKERPVVVRKAPEPVEPTIVYADAEAALRALMESECEVRTGSYEELVCFHCGSELDYEAHSPTCSYIAAKVLVDRLDKGRAK